MAWNYPFPLSSSNNFHLNSLHSDLFTNSTSYKHHDDFYLLNAIYLEKMRRPYSLYRPVERVNLSRPIRPLSVPCTDLPQAPLEHQTSISSTLSSTASSELSHDTEFLECTAPFLKSQTGLSPASTALPEKYLTGSGNREEPEIPNYHHRPTGTVTPIRDVNSSRNAKKKTGASDATHASTQTECRTVPSPSTPMLSLCREITNMIVERTGEQRSYTSVDVILRSCESIKVAVVTILEAFSHSKNATSADTSSFADCDTVKVASTQLVSALEMLVSHATLWARSFTDVQSNFIIDLTNTVTATINELSTELLAFLQGCESGLEPIAEEASGRVIEQLFLLVKVIGQLALANGACPLGCLMDTGDLTAHLPNDVTQMKPSDDLRQSFIEGTDEFFHWSAENCVSRISGCLETMKTLVDVCRNSGTNIEESILEYAYVVIATVKQLLVRCQEVQTELTQCVKETDKKAANYFLHYFHRNQSLVSHLSLLLDGSTLLVQAAQPYTESDEKADMRKVYRCTEMVQRCIPKVVAGSVGDVTLDESCDKTDSDNQLAAGRLFEAQTDSIIPASQEVTLATHALIDFVRKRLEFQNAQGEAPQRVKRMLPATPGRNLVRSHSARTDKPRISTSLSLDFTPHN